MSRLFPRDLANWSKTRLRFCVEAPRNGAWGGEPGTDEKDVVCVRVADFSWDQLSVRLEEPTIRSISLDQFKKLALKRGDLLLEKSGGGEKSPVGRVVRFESEVEAISSNFIARIRPRESVISSYLTYLWAALYMTKWSHQFIKQNTGIQNLDDDAVLDTPVLIPGLPTQRVIAHFLDRETARIDQLIEKKEQHIELALERQAALLDRMTFRSDELSGWMRVPFKWVCRIPNGQVDPKEEPWSEMPLIAPNHIESRTGRVLNIESAAEQGAESGKYTYPAGTVLYSKIRPALAKACIAPENGLCSADMYPIIPARSLLPGFLLMQLLSGTFTDWAVVESMRVAMPKVNRETLGPFPLIVAPIERQNELVGEWSAESNRTQDLVAKIRASIGKLSELRSTLITAAVTGQIDVATWGKGDETDRRLEAIEHGLEAERERVGV